MAKAAAEAEAEAEAKVIIDRESASEKRQANFTRNAIARNVRPRGPREDKTRQDRRINITMASDLARPKGKLRRF